MEYFLTKSWNGSNKSAGTGSGRKKPLLRYGYFSKCEIQTPSACANAA